MAESTEAGPALTLTNQLKDVLVELTRHPFPYLPSPPDLKKRASVTLIIRINPSHSHWPDQSLHNTSASIPLGSDGVEDTVKRLGAFFAQEWVQQGDPEALFIKRANRKGDKWTGHVALPGGGRDLEDADDRATSIRETWEEVGVDLSPKNAIPVGNLPQRLVTSSWVRWFGDYMDDMTYANVQDLKGKIPLMILCPYVFLIRRHDLPPLKLQPSEVAGAHWVPLRELLSPESRTFEWQDVSGRLAKQEGRWAPKRLYYRLILGHMLFSAVKLKPSESLIATPENVAGLGPGTENQKNVLNSITEWMKETTGFRPTMEQPLLLWGLTLGVMADFLELLPPHNALQLWAYPTFSSLDVRFLIWLLSWRFRSQKFQAMSNIPATVPASIELGLDSIPMPSRDASWIKENPPCSGEAGLGINPYEGPSPQKRKRRGSRSSRVGFMLEGYYDIIGRGIFLSFCMRSALFLVLAALAVRRIRRRST